MTQGIRMSDGKGGWLDRQGNAKIWNGKNWQGAKVWLYTGSEWRLVSSQTYTTTWDATWTQSYWGDTSWSRARNLSFSARPRNNKGNKLLQGRFTNPDIRWEGDGGIQGGLVGFNDGDIRNKLRGANIKSVQLFLQSEHWWYTSGGSAVIGTHNANGWQGKFTYRQLDIARQRFNKRNDGHWITLPNWVGTQFRDNVIKGFVTYVGSTDPSYYGYFYGTDDWRKPKLRITYEK